MGRHGKKGEAGGPEGMKACYKAAKESGDREEEARWANQIGHAFKERGKYVDALTWFRLDYDISIKRDTNDGGPRLNLMPTCQSLGEVYYRLGEYEEARHYQQRHLDLAVEANNLVEQQRAHTQLGRTYMDMYDIKDWLWALPKAKESLNKAMDLAQTLKASPPPGSSNFVIELVDAYNNLGTLKMITDEPVEARRLLQMGLRLCNAEEVGENDATRTRLHHNLGRLYSEKCQWSAAMIHSLKDIEICRAIPHPQGEVKGLINLADIHFKQRQYTDAIKCYSIALQIVRKLQDEDDLKKTVESNKNVVEAAVPKLGELNANLAELKELQTKVDAAQGSASERSLCLQEHKMLVKLIREAFELQYWEEHLKLAKRLKKIVNALGDLEKAGDALNTLGESYFHLCNYEKAKKWHHKSFKVCERVQHGEGQAVALINYGNALDCMGDSRGALKAYEDAYEILKPCEETRLLPPKIQALENIQYCYLVRFNRVEDASELQVEVTRLKQLKKDLQDAGDNSDGRCMETDDEADKDSATQSTDDDEELEAVQVPLVDDTNIIEKSSTRVGNSVQSSNIVSRSQAQDQRKRSRLVSSDEESEESAGAMSPTPPKRRLSRLGAKNTTQAESDLPLTASRSRRAVRVETLNLSSDDDEPLENIWNASLAGRSRRKQNANIGSRIHVPSKNVTPSRSSKARGRLMSVGNPSQRVTNELSDESQPAELDILARNDMVLQHPRGVDSSVATQDLKKRADLGSLPKRHLGSTLPSNDIPVEQRVTVQPKTSVAPRITEQRVGLASQTPVRGPKAGSHTSNKKHGVVEDPSLGRSWEMCEQVHTLGGSRCEGRTPSHHDPAASHSSGTPILSSQMQPPLIVPVNINGQTLRVIMRRSSEADSTRTVSWLLEEILHLYSCDNSAGKKPVVQRLEYKGSTLKPVQIVEEVLNDITHEDRVDAIIQGWVDIPLVERYEAHCLAANCGVNTALVTKLKYLKGSYEEVDASSCNLQDESVRPLIAALKENDALSALDLSHNSLGNGTMSAIQEMIAATNQSDLGLTLDLHQNRLGAGALLQICKCPVTLSRLEVLKLSGNRLTDAAARNLATILVQSKALATLEVEECGLTTRTIQQISSSLHPDCSLVKLCIGRNNPIGGSALTILFQKLSTLISFTELDIRGVELDEKGVLAVTSLMQSSSTLSLLNMAGCEIQNHGAQIMCRAMTGMSVQLLNLNLSACGFSQGPAIHICQQLISIHGLASLNLSNNQLSGQAAETLASAVSQEECRLKSLSLNNCCVGHSGVLNLLRSLQGNTVLWELHAAGNFELKTLEKAAVLASPSHVPQKDPDELACEPPMLSVNQECRKSDPCVRLNERENLKDDNLKESNFEQALETNACAKTEEPNSEPMLLNDLCGIHEHEMSFSQDLDSAELEMCNQLLNGLPEMEGAHIKVTEPAAVDNTMAIEVFDNAIGELVLGIRMARGLQCLDLRYNGLSSEHTKQLWEAWSYGGRSVKKEFLDKAHFLVQEGKECSSLTPTCPTCQSPPQ